MTQLYNHQNNNIQESLEHGDLKRVLRPTLHIDEFKSKMGEDRNISVLSFKIMNKEPAEDLVNFIEKGYSWVLDADSSPGEMEDGDYIVFIEAERTGKLPGQIIQLIEDILNLTLQKIEDWQFLYYKNTDYQSITLENLNNSIPLSPREYDEKFGENPVREMKIAAGVPVTGGYTKTPHISQLQVWAGIK
jgi:hypothetical protein